MRGRSEGPAHAAGLDDALAILQAEGWRVVKCGPSLPPVVASDGARIIGAALQERRRRGEGWKPRHTRGMLVARWAWLDEVRVFPFRSGERKRILAEAEARLKAEGWRVVRTGRKVPDALAVRPGCFLAVEHLRAKSPGAIRSAAHGKRLTYAVWDEVRIFEALAPPPSALP